jgi:hypothetical protein
MMRSLRRLAILAAATASAVLMAVPTANAQSAPTLLGHPELLTVAWYGPFGISPNDTARFVYSNLGADSVLIEWAFTNAETGELVCTNFGKPQQIAVKAGAIWDYQQTLSVDPTTGNVTETRICNGQGQVSDELYFDATLRHELVAWIFIQHASQAGMKNAVDLPAVQLFDSALQPGCSLPPPGTFPPNPCRSVTYGRTLTFIQANPIAPTTFPKALIKGN